MQKINNTKSKYKYPSVISLKANGLKSMCCLQETHI